MEQAVVDPAVPAEGQQMRVKGLEKSKDLNGMLCTLLRYETEKERWVCELQDGRLRNLKVDNLEQIA